MTAMRLLTFVVLIAPAFAADPAGFGLWRASELQQRDKSLATRVGADHSARETLGDYKDHRLRMLFREGQGSPEQHDKIVDVWLVQSGEGTLIVGGTMLNPKGSAATGEYLGISIEGGERHEVAAGDVIHIPAKIPHGVIVAPGKHFTYIVVKFPAQ